MAFEREHRVDDRELDRLSDDIARSDPEFDVPGKLTRAELVHRVTAMVAAEALRRPVGNPGKHAVSAPKLSFHDFQALALRDVLSRLDGRRGLREATLAAADPRVARRVAEQARRGPGVVDHASSSRDGEGLWEAAQRRAVTLYRRANDAGVVSTRSSEVDAALAAIGSGAALPRDVCQMMEPIFGVRLDRVRIHSGSVAQRACDAVNADAFTVGEDIFLPRWDPRSPACRELLAHELVHCLQWWQGRIGPSANRAVSRPNDALEQEADRFVRGINFDRLDRRERTPSRNGSQRQSSSHLWTQPAAPSLIAPVMSSPVAPVPNVLPSSAAQEAPSPVLSVAQAPNTIGPFQMVMRSANRKGDDRDPYGIHSDGNETWNSPNWQYWKDLAASMWLPPIGEVLKKDARLLVDNVWLVFGGITLTMGLAYVAIVATGIVGAAAAIATWLAVWGMPAWATQKVVSDWLDQVERVKGNEEQAIIAKEKFAQVVVTLALFLARMKAPKKATVTSSAPQAERSAAAAPKQLEVRSPASKVDGVASQLPAPNVPARSKHVPAKRGPNVRAQLPAIGATPSFIGPPTEQQFLDQHPLVFGSPEPGEFDGIDRPGGNDIGAKQLKVKDTAGNDVGIWIDPSKPNRVTVYSSDLSDSASQPRVIGYINFEITNIDLEDTLEVKYIYRDPDFRDARIGDLLFETMIREHRLPQIYSRLSERNLHWFYQALTDHFRDRLRLANGALLDDVDQFLDRGIPASELQEAALKALEKTRVYQSQIRLGYHMVREASGLRWTKQERLERVPTMVFRQSESDALDSTVGQPVAGNVPPSREQQYLNQHPVMGGSPEAGKLGQPTPNTDAVKALIKSARQRTIFLDYDGTLVGFKVDPEACAPDPELLEILRGLQSNPKNKVIIISGRPHQTLEKWLGQFPFTLIGEHGIWTREAKVGGTWSHGGLSNAWKDDLKAVMKKEKYQFKDPTTKKEQTRIEEKTFGLVWHYRAVQDQVRAEEAASQLVAELKPLCEANGLQVLPGKKIVEVKPAGVNKGTAASKFVGPELNLVLGDDATDEYMLAIMPDGSLTIKVGGDASVAKYRLETVNDARAFLRELIDQ